MSSMFPRAHIRSLRAIILAHFSRGAWTFRMRACRGLRPTVLHACKSVTSVSSNISRRDIVQTCALGLAGLAALRPVLAEAASTSKMGLDLTPMSESEAMKEAERLGITQSQQKILFRAGTEMAGTGKTVNGYSYGTKEDGVWVSAVSGIPLFDSSAKYESGTGWPSFFRAVDPAHVIEQSDPMDPIFLRRVEVLDRKSRTHLGHVFKDGPRPTGKRYCMNAAALRFIPRKDYDEWLKNLPKTKGPGRSDL